MLKRLSLHCSIERSEPGFKPTSLGAGRNQDTRAQNPAQAAFTLLLSKVQI